MRALLSVYDKTGIVELARRLHELGVELVSSGGTAKVIAEAVIPVIDVADHTGLHPILDHKVVTLHPKIHGGILADTSKPEHLADMAEYGIVPFDMVVVNLYPFSSDPSIDLIDIGGPTMVRAAAKNHARVAVVVDPADYDDVLKAIDDAQRAGEKNITGTHFGEYLCKKLAAKAFSHTAAYDALIATWMWEQFLEEGELPPSIHIAADRIRTLGKGENGHQRPAAIYSSHTDDPLAIANFEVLEGNPGWVNWTDNHRSITTLTAMVAALEVNCGTDASRCHALGVKHGNASGAAFASDPITALRKMLMGNLISIHGGWVMVDFPIGEEEAHELRRLGLREGAPSRIFAGVVAPEISDEARSLLHRKDGTFVAVVNPALAEITVESLSRGLHVRQVRDDYMVQPHPSFVLDLNSPSVDATLPIHMEHIPNLTLAWAIGSTSNSNTTAIVGENRLYALACGQQDRVGAAKLMLERFAEANRALTEAHLPPGDITLAAGYSDSFFPFEDGLEVFTTAGVGTVFASSGGKNFDRIRTWAEQENVCLVTQPDAECRGFFGH